MERRPGVQITVDRSRLGGRPGSSSAQPPSRRRCTHSDAAARSARSSASSLPGGRGSTHDQRQPIGIGDQPALHQPSGLGHRRPVDARGGRAGAVGADRVDLHRRDLRGPSRPHGVPWRAIPARPRVSTGSTRGSTSTSVGRRVHLADADAQRIADAQARRLDGLAPATREARLGASCGRGTERLSVRGAAPCQATSSPPGKGTRPYWKVMDIATVDSSSTRVARQPPRKLHATRRQRHPGRRPRAQQQQADAGHVQRGRGEAGGDHAHEHPERGQRRVRASQRRHPGQRVAHHRLALRARPPPAPSAGGAPAPTAASSWTSSGSAWSRPSSAARALAALSSINPARGLAPSSVRGSLARLLEHRHHVASQGVAGVHADRRLLGGQHLGDRGHRLEVEDSIARRVVGQHLGLLGGGRDSPARRGS